MMQTNALYISIVTFICRNAQALLSFSQSPHSKLDFGLLPAEIELPHDKRIPWLLFYILYIPQNNFFRKWISSMP